MWIWSGVSSVVDGVSFAMWSGPRNISTAMMYSFDNREDCFASDEPLYSHYLARPGINQPGPAALIAHPAAAPDSEVEYLTAELPADRGVWSQTHMCHNIIPEL